MRDKIPYKLTIDGETIDSTTENTTNITVSGETIPMTTNSTIYWPSSSYQMGGTSYTTSMVTGMVSELPYRDFTCCVCKERFQLQDPKDVKKHGSIVDTLFQCKACEKKLKKMFQ